MVKIHTSKDAIWKNAAGDSVPVKFVPKADRLKESLSHNILKHSLQAEKQLKALHGILSDAFAAVEAAVKEDFEIKTKKPKKQGKGSFTWYNFDKSLKIEADINEISKWDGALMTEALNLLNAYLDASLSDANLLVKELVNSAFSNSSGMIDSKKVFQLLKYENKIKNAKFLKACELIKQAQSVDKTKLYMRVWEKQNDGQYRNINLNFSSL